LVYYFVSLFVKNEHLDMVLNFVLLIVKFLKTFFTYAKEFKIYLIYK